MRRARYIGQFGRIKPRKSLQPARTLRINVIATAFGNKFIFTAVKMPDKNKTNLGLATVFLLIQRCARVLYV